MGGSGVAPGVILLVAGPGYGKTTWATSHLPDGAVVISAADADAAALARLAQDPPSAVVVEDLHDLHETARGDLLEALDALPDSTELVVTSRTPLGRTERGRLSRPARERGPDDLALTPAQVAALLAEEYDLADPHAPSVVHDLTAGWPVLVHLVADTLARDGGREGGPRGPGELQARLRGLCGPGSTVGDWLEHSVLTTLGDGEAALLADASCLELVTPELVEARRPTDGTPAAVDHLRSAARTGLIRPHPRWELLGSPAQRVVPLLAELLRADRHLDASFVVSCAGWFDGHGFPGAAVEALRAVGRRGEAESLLRRRGTELIGHGDGPVVCEVLDSTDPDGEARLLLAEAHRLAGRADLAHGLLRPLAERAGDRGWDVALACGLAAVHDMRCEYDEGLAVIDRAAPEELAVRPDQAVRWRALRATLLACVGRSEEAHETASQALVEAQRSGRPADLARAHQAVARVSTGHRKAVHVEAARGYARQAGDGTTLALLLLSHGYRLLADARYPEAADLGRTAVRTCELVRPVGALVVALHNLAEALCRTGEYAEARWHLRRAVEVGRALGGGRAASSLSGLGDLHRALGQREQGRRAYEEAIALARESGERQVLVPALAGLARLACDEAPEEATALAEEAVALAPRPLASAALVALTWARIAAGDPAAGDCATRAVEAAREDLALDLLAEALEAMALAQDEPAQARDALLEAHGIWSDAGAGPDQARVEVLLARVDGAGRDARDRGRLAAERLATWGVTRVAGSPAGQDPVAADVAIAVLGGFEVTVRHRRVAMQAWRSRQARTLVKLLAARRGRPTSRDALCELLWPDDDPARTPHRLSVLLATVRSVLDPDKTMPADHFVASDTRGVWLDLRRVSIDADEVITEAELGAGLVAAGHRGQAAEVLTRVDQRYRGDAFEDEPFEAWATDLREEARTAWVRSVRHLATLAGQDARHHDSAALLARLLRVDPYDERVHAALVRTLVRAGRHGEARRAFGAWVEAMREVDAPPPDPQALVPPPRRASRPVG